MRYKKKLQCLQQANKRIKEQDLPRNSRSSNEVKTTPRIWSVCPLLLYPYMSTGQQTATNWQQTAADWAGQS